MAGGQISLRADDLSRLPLQVVGRGAKSRERLKPKSARLARLALASRRSRGSDESRRVRLQHLIRSRFLKSLGIKTRKSRPLVHIPHKTGSK
jgi:hypothetical protein